MRVLVTGGAGFIGSHLVARYVADGHDVAVLDDLSTGYVENVPDGVELHKADVGDLDAVRKAVDGVELVFHEAASRAVLKSVEDPLQTDHANTRGTLNVLVAARDAGVRRMVIASSSSVYGGVAALPTPESSLLTPKSPYAVSKMAAEHYTRVFAELYSLETVALRYFNVFGPRQRPDSQYAAVIPLFIDAALNGVPPVVHGDGLQSRDFTFIDDVVAANVLAASAPAEQASGRAFNIACNQEASLLDLLRHISDAIGVPIDPEFVETRAGDIKHSRAEISLAAKHLGYAPSVDLATGLARTVDWVRSTRQS